MYFHTQYDWWQGSVSPSSPAPSLPAAETCTSVFPLVLSAALHHVHGFPALLPACKDTTLAHQMSHRQQLSERILGALYQLRLAGDLALLVLLIPDLLLVLTCLYLLELLPC